MADAAAPAPPPPPFTDGGFASTGTLLWAVSLVFIMTPGVGLLYSGMARSKNALSLIMTSMLAMAIITLQWVIFGFSFTFSEGGSPLMGNFQFAGLQNVSEKHARVRSRSVLDVGIPRLAAQPRLSQHHCA
ncbi:ammonium transporter AmtB-like domain-containing protein [Entophlyctis helioformis]|nr:ammonium transporter AmtB-like domain-containing protein [Entophlyctis helioformis]